MKVNGKKQKEQSRKGKNQRVKDRQHTEGRRERKRQRKRRETINIVHRLLCWVRIPADMGTTI